MALLPKLIITFDKAGVYSFYVILNARSQDNIDILSHRTHVKALIGGAVEPEMDTEAIHLCEEERWNNTYAGGRCVTLGSFCVLNRATPEPIPLTIAETQAVHEISPDSKSIFINRPTVSGGAAPCTIAYNCYDAESRPVNYYYSDDARTAMTPGYNGRFNVFVVVRDSAGAQAQIDTGWLDLTGNEAQPLTVLEEVAVSEISPDGRSIFINRPTISGGTHDYTIAYNCYDTESRPVNYYYSDEWRTAMTPGCAGRFCVFVVVSDGNETVIINTGWYELKP